MLRSSDDEGAQNWAQSLTRVSNGNEGSGSRFVYRDPDVLDTWFSSALWPFSTLGWPEETPELARYYKTDVLITGFDIIFFWVARMMMAGIELMDEVPFHTVYINSIVVDEHGKKMSKSIGNVIDPLDLIAGIDVDTAWSPSAPPASPNPRTRRASRSRPAPASRTASRPSAPTRCASPSPCRRCRGGGSRG